MTEFFLNAERVYPKDEGTWKLNIVNTFFEDAGSYTLEISFPLDVIENRNAFGNINRQDVSKHPATFDAKIVADSKLVFCGTAKITGVTDTEVKLQMLGGNSKVNFWTKAEKMYIDEFDYEYTDYNNTMEGFVDKDGQDGLPIIKAGTFPGRKGIYCYVPVLDESGAKSTDYSETGLWNEHKYLIHQNDQSILYHGGTEANLQPLYIAVSRECISPNLMFVTKWIFNYLGYTLKRNDRDNEMVNSIYIANARHTTTNERGSSTKNSADERSMAKALPHWTVAEFIQELKKFLNASIVFDDINATVDIIGNAYYAGTEDITEGVKDQYSVEIIEDEDAKTNLYDSNVCYKKGESEYHAIDMVDMEIPKSFTEVRCTLDEALKQWESMSGEERKVRIWTTEKGQYCAKINEESLEFIRFNHFGAIVRNTDNDDNVELKISPVATTMEIYMPVFEYSKAGSRIYRDPFEVRWQSRQNVLCLHNQYEAANKPTVWDAINDNLNEGSEKEDIMQVFLMDGVTVKSTFYSLPYQMPFTSHEWNVPNNGTPHKSWSLALDNDDSELSMATFHKDSKKQNRNAEHVISFTSEKIPSVYSIYIIRNKRYACKKLELTFSGAGMDKAITGYFEEIL